ncbi:hypothetical protein OT109_11920 [Phycisphaeraceae bacterium D3-23]
MSDVIRVLKDVDGQVPGPLLPVPSPERLSGGAVSIRDAVESDIPFIDALQKANSAGVGFMHMATLQGHLAQGHVLVAEQVNSEPSTVNSQGHASPVHCSPGTVHSPASPVGYCIGVDKYFKREDVGVIYHMNIAPERRRGLVAAVLLRAMFDRSAYGVKLYCCWCAQDLSANRFWEAMGFVPLAFRTGSRKKSWKGEDGARHKGPRIHIFWQKRIRAGDEGPGATPWWFPSQTGGGAMREDRIVLPIPPGTHWSDAKPAVLPGVDVVFGEIADEREEALKLIAGAEGSGAKGLSAEEKAARKAERKAKREQAERERAEAAERAASVASGGLHFGPPEADSPNGKSDAAKQARKEAEKAAQKKVSKKNDPQLVAMARELRDRWQEHVVAQPGMIEDRRQGKYDVSRLIEASPPQVEAVEIVSEVQAEPKRLDAA